MSRVDESCEVISCSDFDRPDIEKPDKCENILSCDQILGEIGSLGIYQVLIGFVTGVAIILSSLDLFNFVFAATIPEHRCWISECESSDTSNFHANWTKFAIPLESGTLDSCSRYAYTSTVEGDSCNELNFNQSQVIPCDGYIIKDHEERLINYLNQLCTDRERSMPLIGTASTTGKVAGILFTGIVSDKFGRLNTFVGCLVLSSIFGCLQVLPVPLMSFELYAVLEFLAAFVASGVLGATCTFNMEWVLGKHRIHLNSMALFMDAFHPVFIGLAAWYYADSFVRYKLSMALSGFLIIAFYFVLDEPPQWLLARQKYSHLIESIKKAGRINRRPPSAQLIDQIISHPMNTVDKTEEERHNNHHSQQQVTLGDLFRTKALVVRLAAFSFLWLCRTIAYYGIILISTTAHDNKYISFILIGLAEVPGALLSMLILKHVGRRTTNCLSLLVYGLLLLASTQVPTELRVVQLILFCVSRAALKVSTIGICSYASELWPTAVRNRAFNICSFFGRCGAILASLFVLLEVYHPQLPVILYGSAALVAAGMPYLFLPETMHCRKMPDTIEEALAIGKNTTDKNQSGG